MEETIKNAIVYLKKNIDTATPTPDLIYTYSILGDRLRRDCTKQDYDESMDTQRRAYYKKLGYEEDE